MFSLWSRVHNILDGMCQSSKDREILRESPGVKVSKAGMRHENMKRGEKRFSFP